MDQDYRWIIEIFESWNELRVWTIQEKCMGSVRTMEFGFYVIEDSSLGGKGK